MKSANLNRSFDFVGFMKKHRLGPALLAVGIFLLMAGFYMMARKEEITGIVFMAVGLFVIGVSQYES